ncbi:MAG: P-II family nitrogen regulator [Flavobacteriaceae bacterium]|nr:P-II family nitrogen regulator [Flavobacteriaceae bacterium]MCY4217525.1 P-II family nitrogen regulator [Flavobacteriaceae bacterium]MCY4254128.1 P-II family nitrogen regulator [Flavobacteriaceae bacterium]
MKKIEAIIRESQFLKVRDALKNLGVKHFTYWDVTGVGKEKQPHVYRGVNYESSAINRRFISLVVSEDLLDAAIEALLDSASTNEVGDGKIFVLPVEKSIRIRTKESGPSSL